MAAAIRVATSCPAAGSSTLMFPLALMARGEFGERVAGMLAEMFPGSQRMATSDLAEAFAGGYAAVVIVTSWPLWELYEDADRLAYRHRRPWLPVVMEHPQLRIGPMVCPPMGPCFACYRARRLQHDTQYRASAVLGAAYDSGASAGPAGYLPHLARFALGAATHCLSDALGQPGSDGAIGTGGAIGSGAAGSVLTFDVLSSRVSASRVVSCQGCDREQRAPIADAPLDLAKIAMTARRSADPAMTGSRELVMPR